MTPPKEKPPGKLGKPHGKPPGKYPHKTYEIRVFLLVSSYSGELELLTTIDYRSKDVFSDHGKCVVDSRVTVEEYVRNIGLFGITVEDPEGIWSFYPPQRIGKIEYEEVDKD